MKSNMQPMAMLAINNSSLSLLQEVVYRSVDIAESRYKRWKHKQRCTC